MRVGRSSLGAIAAAGCGRWAAAALGCVLLSSAGGCAPEERVVKYKPFLSGLENVQTGTPAVIPDEWKTAGLGHAVEGEITEEGSRRIVIRNPDGSVRLLSRTVRDLMTHLERVLDEDQPNLFAEQLISPKTVGHLASEGRTPEDLFRVLQGARREIARMFARMPFGDSSPTVIMEKTGKREFVVRLTGQAARDVRFTRMWVTIEGGHYKFMWLD